MKTIFRPLLLIILLILFISIFSVIIYVISLIVMLEFYFYIYLLGIEYKQIVIIVTVLIMIPLSIKIFFFLLELIYSEEVEEYRQSKKIKEIINENNFLEIERYNLEKVKEIIFLTTDFLEKYPESDDKVNFKLKNKEYINIKEFLEIYNSCKGIFDMESYTLEDIRKNGSSIISNLKARLKKIKTEIDENKYYKIIIDEFEGNKYYYPKYENGSILNIEDSNFNIIGCVKIEGEYTFSYKLQISILIEYFLGLREIIILFDNEKIEYKFTKRERASVIKKENLYFESIKINLSIEELKKIYKNRDSKFIKIRYIGKNGVKDIKLKNMDRELLYSSMKLFEMQQINEILK